MLPTSHRCPTHEARPLLSNAAQEESLSWPAAGRAASPDLAGAFAEFIATSARLERAYGELQREVETVRGELLQRNADLRASAAENERMRVALEELVDAMPCGVVVLDADGQVSMTNAECLQLLAMPAHAETADLSAKLAQVLPASLFCHTTAGLREFECETSIEEEGPARWLQVRRRILPSRADRVGAQYLLVLRDVSAMRAAEQEREQGRTALAHAEISTMLAHEVRNPLASLELFAEMIEQDETRRREWISHLRAGIRSLAGTVNNVLTFYGTRSWPESAVVMSAVLREAVAFLAPAAKQSGVALRVAIEDGSEDAVVWGNLDALRQLLLNLVTNGVRHSPAGGWVELSLRCSQAAGEATESGAGCFLLVECRDSGCGIAAEALPRIFEAGFSATGTSAGLGLAVSRRIAQRHRAALTAENTMEGGALLRLTLPLGSSASEPEACA